MEARGLGRVYRPMYPEKKAGEKTGKRKHSAVWWIQYSLRGKVYRENSHSTSRVDAVKLLKRRLGEIGRGKLIGPQEERVTFEALVADFIRDYEVRGLRSLDTARGRVAHLCAFFGGDRAVDIMTDRIRSYQAHRLHETATAGTVNRETAALSRMFTLAVKGGRLSARPAFPARLEENPPRQGFFEHAEYLAIREHLPLDYEDVLDFAYYSGWRKKEITQLTWPEVDLDGGVIRLSPKRSKAKTGRVLPLSSPLQDVLARRLAARRLDTSLVFHKEGQPIGDWRKSWSRACRLAGFPDKHLHDCRRTVARNLIRSGVPERVAMALLGHKTRSVFDRYNIVSEADLKQATARLTAYIATQPTTPRVVPFSKAAKGAGP